MNTQAMVDLLCHYHFYLVKDMVRILDIEPRASHILDKHSTIKL